MTGVGAAPRIVWRSANVIEVVQETREARTLVLDVPGWPGHRAGQHVDVRLTAEDGYQAERSYSIASAPEEPHLSLTIERLDDGEVSPYLSDELRAGEKLELRGPIGGYFVWDVGTGGPLLLVAGGSGIVPLMAMLRHRDRALSTDTAARHRLPVRLLYSSRRWDDVIYRDELARLAERDTTLEVNHTLTREQPDGWTGFKRRIDRAMLEAVAWPASEQPRVFVCGPTALVEAVATNLVGLGHQPALVKTERFGPTGGSV
ncbi:MAG: ferredoxin reductase [Gemmatimonadota bacterium]|nr:ferredoxin reductase [Gemmatimonadota bacterium]